MMKFEVLKFEECLQMLCSRFINETNKSPKDIKGDPKQSKDGLKSLQFRKGAYHQTSLDKYQA